MAVFSRYLYGVPVQNGMQRLQEKPVAVLFTPKRNRTPGLGIWIVSIIVSMLKANKATAVHFYGILLSLKPENRGDMRCSLKFHWEANYNA